jgi:hypothetical protein
MGEVETHGLFLNQANVVQAEDHRVPFDGELVYGTQYNNETAVGSSGPNKYLYDQSFTNKNTSNRILTGFYSIRLFYDCDPKTTPEYMDWVLSLEIYEDGELKVWNTGDEVDGIIKIPYVDDTLNLGCRVILWFDPSKDYEIKVKTSPTLPGTYMVNLDYLQFTPLYHGHPLMSWVNSSEIIGGELWMIDSNTDTITGNGTSVATGSILTTYPFKQIMKADVTVESSTASYHATPYNIGTNSFNYAVRNVTGANWSTTLTVRWNVMGLVDLPFIRPL